MTRRHMEVYVALCDNNGNMTRTAEAFYMAQPAVSRILSELEAHYGVTFFARISRKLYITNVAFGVSPTLGYTAGQTITVEELLSKPLLVRTVGCGARTAFGLALVARG